jgi:hypothetical protein
MATWVDILSYLRANFAVAEDSGGLLKIFCSLGDCRQLVVVERTTVPSFPSEVWATISSPVATANGQDVDTILETVGQRYTVGGLVRVGDSLLVRHSVPLSSMNLHEFIVPFHLVMTTAAELERSLKAGDLR